MNLKNKFILDACCGGRMFWFTKAHPNTLYIDIRKEEKGCIETRPNFEVNPNIIMDYRNLGYLQDKKFKLIVWDPPHRKFTKTAYFAKKYGSLNDNWRNDLKLGFNEIWAHLEDHGVLIFKWSQERIKIKEILDIIPKKPLFGHTVKSKNQTIWMCFMKIQK